MANKNYIKKFEKLSISKKVIVVFIALLTLVIITKLALHTKINLNTIELINKQSIHIPESIFHEN